MTKKIVRYLLSLALLLALILGACACSLFGTNAGNAGEQGDTGGTQSGDNNGAGSTAGPDGSDDTDKGDAGLQQLGVPV